MESSNSRAQLLVPPPLFVEFGGQFDCGGQTLGIDPVSGHITWMSKSPRVVFQPKRITETDWQIEAAIPGAEIRIISGLTSKADVDDWMSGSRKVAWLRSQGYAK
jgi:hypothetical protein